MFSYIKDEITSSYQGRRKQSTDTVTRATSSVNQYFSPLQELSHNLLQAKPSRRKVNYSSVWLYQSTSFTAHTPAYQVYSNSSKQTLLALSSNRTVRID